MTERKTKRDMQRFVRLTVNDTSCICEPAEVASIIDDPGLYAQTDIWMTRAAFEELPEFMGW